MMPASQSLVQIQQKIDEVMRFLTIALSISNAHTVEFYTHDVWNRFMAVAPKEVLSAVTACTDHQREHELKENGGLETTFGFCPESHRLVNIHELLKAARMLSLPGLGICLSRDELLQSVQQICSSSGDSTEDSVSAFETDEFMNTKKSHEVQCMSEVVAHLARGCHVKQVIDVGSGKGYLSSFLSMQYGLQVYGIDSSSINTHGAQERSRKLKKFSKAYRQQSKAQKRSTPQEETQSNIVTLNDQRSEIMEENRPSLSFDGLPVEGHLECQESPGDLFLSALSLDIIETTSLTVPSCQLTDEERERRKRENLERKALNRTGSESPVFSPITSYVTADTELRALISELQAAVLVGLHTCGDLAPSSLRMFVAKTELSAVCSVGCCYHLLSEEFDPNAQDNAKNVCGFPLSQYLREQSYFCGRNARMSACLALERVSHGQGIQMESLFYRAVLHVILRDHYGSFKSEKRVGNVYSKTKSFVDYVRRALQRLELDEMKLSDSDIQGYHDKYRTRMNEMHAFNMLKVTLAPCIEGFLLLDRLCYLKEQENVSYSALVQLFDRILSPRCYAVIGLKKNR